MNRLYLVLCDRPIRGPDTKQIPAVPQLSFKSLLLQELLLTGILYQTLTSLASLLCFRLCLLAVAAVSIKSFAITVHSRSREMSGKVAQHYK